MHANVAPDDGAAQHIAPRPLPLFLAMVHAQHQKNPELARRALDGLRKLQHSGYTRARPGLPIAAQAGRAALYDYGGDGPVIVLVPSLINPSYILDIAPPRSLVAQLRAAGFRPMLVDWDNGPINPASTLTDHVSKMLQPMLRSIDTPYHLIGYCLGGTLALASAPQLTPRSLTLIATPWHFSGYDAAARDVFGPFWSTHAPLAERLGALPIEALQTLFWALDPDATVAKYARFADESMTPDGRELFIAIEGWANSGAPLPYATAAQLFADIFIADAPGRGGWLLGGQPVQPDAITCPILNIVSTTDRIAPAATATTRGSRLDVALGHVGMITGSRASVQVVGPIIEWLSQHR